MEKNEGNQRVASPSFQDTQPADSTAFETNTLVPLSQSGEDAAPSTQPHQIPQDEGDAPVEDSSGIGDNSHESAPVEPGSSPRLHSATHVAGGVQPPKRFSAMNINKKFLEKTSSSSAAGSSHTSLGSTSSKQGSVIARPTPQVAPSHSRLVTAKLTTNPLSSSASSQGWSRPSSATPPAATPSGSSGLSVLNQMPAVGSAGSSAPHLPVAGKIIHPQVRAALKLKPDSTGGNAKPAWGAVQNASQVTVLQAQSDFPTAAEAAKGPVTQPPKALDAKAAADSAAQKQATDAFRGVHLDPNAHHWDEMEEDDNDFLDGVIEFGDGTQYKIQVEEQQTASTAGQEAVGRQPNDIPPVNKGERFADDFDRSWPIARDRHSKLPHLDSPRDQAPHSASPRSAPSSSHGQAVSPTESTHSRVLFNERSNKMEPYSSGHRSSGLAGSPGVPQIAVRQGSHSEHQAGQGDFRRRDLPPHQNIQAVQKPESVGPNGVADAAIIMGEDNGSIETGSQTGPSSNAERSRERQRGRRDSSVRPPPLVPMARVPSKEPERGRRDHYNPHGISPVSPRPRDRQLPVAAEPRGRHSTLGPPPLPQPPSSSRRDSSSDAGRHQTPLLPESSHHVPPRRSSFRDNTPYPGPPLRTSLPLVNTSPPASQITPTGPQSTVLSPASEMPQLSPMVLTLALESADIDPHKAFLHASAERAKQRRQQEEEERAQAQARARQKAAELEAKMATAKAAEAEARKFIEDANKSVKPPDEQKPLEPSQDKARTSENLVVKMNSSEHPTPANASWSRTPSTRGLERPPPAPSMQRRVSHITAHASVQYDSWRMTTSAQPVISSSSTSRTSVPPTSVLPETLSFDLQPGEELEVVDFKDLAKLVGGDEEETELLVGSVPPEKPVTTKPPRPVASDFFDEVPSRPETSNEPASWRHSNGSNPPQSPKAAHPPTLDLIATTANERTGMTTRSWETMSIVPMPEDVASAASGGARQSSQWPPSPTRRHGIPEALISASWPTQTVHVPVNMIPLRSPRTPSSFREAPMSALNDAMSRIKGALDGMQSPLTPANSGDKETPETSHVRLSQPGKDVGNAYASRWVPPALRPVFSSQILPQRESFDTTQTQPPSSPRPTRECLNVNLPVRSRVIQAIPRKQLDSLKKHVSVVRFDILTFVPQGEGMKHTLNLYHHLFSRPQVFRNQIKVKVSLPVTGKLLQSSKHTGPKVNIPVPAPSVPKAVVPGAFGRPSMADTTSWRKAIAIATQQDVSPVAPSSGQLDVTSCSPPPQPPTDSDASKADVDLFVDAKLVSSKAKTLLKMSSGAEVAFYRDMRSDSHGSTSGPSVSFTVTSELDASQSPGVSKSEKPVVEHDASPLSTVAQSTASSTSSTLVEQPQCPNTGQLSGDTESAKPSIPDATADHCDSAPPQNKVGSQISTEKEDKDITPLTPSRSPMSTWGKSPLAFAVREPPATRAPDAERLKAVWSQASDKKAMPTINSLKGIADDLTSVPFTLQEVKSEDGGTPPPAPPPQAPSRMSASEVARAFQTVPAGHANPLPITPRSIPFGPPIQPNMHHPTSRSPNVMMSQPAPNSGGRQPFAAYPSPITSHSPSPTMMYAHHLSPNVVPGTPGTAYGQPVWMPLQGHMPQHSPPQMGQMIRTPQSPYNPHMMPYPSPGGPGPMYPVPPSQPNGHTVQGHYSNGPHNRMQMMSPVMPPATPMHHMGMYAASPLLVHPPPQPSLPQPYPAVAVGVGRGTAPGRYDSRQALASAPQQAPGGRFPNHNPGYNHVPPTSFVRPTW